MGHRKSDDIDLFTNISFDASQLLENLHQNFPYQLSLTAVNTLKGSINEVKVDLLAHRYPYIREPVVIDGIKMLSEPDIIAMKLHAIATSGQRSKDFIDIFYLLDKYGIGEMLSFYKAKYDQQNDAFLLKSLIYFDEVDLADWPVLLKKPDLKWKDVKKYINTAVMQYIKKQHADSQ